MQVLFSLFRGWIPALVLAGAVGTVRLAPAQIQNQAAVTGPKTFLGTPTAYDAGIFYLPTAPSDPVPAFRQLIAAKFPKWTVVDAFPKQIDQPMIQVRWERDLPNHYPVPAAEVLKFYARGLTRDHWEMLGASKEALVMSFAWPTNLGLSLLKSTEEILSEMAQQSGGLISDDETREIFSLEQWKATRLARWEGDLPLVSDHITIHAYSHVDSARAVTLGMAKFGLPDLVVEKFSWSVSQPLLRLMHLFAQSLVEHDGQGYVGNFDVDLTTFKHSVVRDAENKVLEGRPSKQAQLYLTKGVPDKGDPQNGLLVIGFDRYPGDDVFTKEQQCLNALFAYKESLHLIDHDKEILKASDEARTHLPELKKRVGQGLAQGEEILVKAAFFSKNKDTEFMWVNVTGWSDDEITGILTNEPVTVPNLHAGQKVTLKESQVFDYFVHHADGKEEGGATEHLLTPGPAASEKK